MIKTIDAKVSSTYEIDKSLFICTIFPCIDADDAKTQINDITNHYPDATHNCSCWITTDSVKMDDDGEPGGTAALPMLEVLKKNDLMNVGAVVTRYYGGIKLGAGGLIRAYSKSMTITLNEAKIVLLEKGYLYRLTFDYGIIKQIEQDIVRFQAIIHEKFYEELINYYVLVKDEELVKYLKNYYKERIDIASLGEDYVDFSGEQHV